MRLPVIQNREEEGLKIRPHHAEGALKSLAAVFGGWEEVREGEEAEPEEVIEMFFDAEDYTISSTSEKTKKAIETKWADNTGFQKVLKLMSDRKNHLEQERDQQLEMFRDAAAILTEDSESSEIKKKWEGNAFFDWIVDDFKAAHEALKKEDESSADEKILQMAREKEAYSNPDESLFGHREMFQKMKESYDADPAGAQITFVNDFDFICKKCVAGGKTPPCLAFLGDKGKELTIDRKVVEAHGWKFNKPYNLGEILKTMMTEATRRKLFLICNDHVDDPEFMEAWNQDVRDSKLAV